MEKPKLNRKEIEEVARRYSLGSVIKAEEMTTGWVNFSYDVLTDNGRYVVQIFGARYNKWKKNQIKMQFAVLNHLQKKGFPYEIPAPIPRRDGVYISDFSGGRHLWAYQRIEGEVVKHLNRQQFNEAVKALALSHGYLRDLKMPGKHTPINFDWALEGYRKIEKITPKNRTDRLVLKNLPLLESYIHRLEKMDFGTRMQMIHTDFNNDNLLYQGNKLVGIIDFDNVEFAPVVKDVALTVKRIAFPQWAIDNRKMKLCVSEYRKYAPLSEREEKLIVPLLVGEDCNLVRWLYLNMRKHFNERHSAIAETLEQTKMLAGWLGWEK